MFSVLPWRYALRGLRFFRMVSLSLSFAQISATILHLWADKAKGKRFGYIYLVARFQWENRDEIPNCWLLDKLYAETNDQLHDGGKMQATYNEINMTFKAENPGEEPEGQNSLKGEEEDGLNTDSRNDDFMASISVLAHHR